MDVRRDEPYLESGTQYCPNCERKEINCVCETIRPRAEPQRMVLDSNDEDGSERQSDTGGDNDAYSVTYDEHSCDEDDGSLASEVEENDDGRAGIDGEESTDDEEIGAIADFLAGGKWRLK